MRIGGKINRDADYGLLGSTGAYNDVVFGLFRLLGYQFCPRLTDLGGARLWRIDSAPDYGPLTAAARHRINTELVI